MIKILYFTNKKIGKLNYLDSECLSFFELHEICYGDSMKHEEGHTLLFIRVARERRRGDSLALISRIFSTVHVDIT